MFGIELRFIYMKIMDYSNQTPHQVAPIADGQICISAGRNLYYQ
jgi:hypothetical protein